ncbi:glutaredoxin 3 [Thioalkalivibrio denitrificans]|uniref:Glutaredoxin n=1 Tax=Thioalkalivibrio denitrificans TaxID=108003 RepID=A0A1V3NBN4_9GAMM|nr:glutaredoxin 3 [Thioalkalivibrio denitrificans]OOG22455.1 glutaredoxin 3 [Thioalkalivibrio denitrificans]
MSMIRMYCTGICPYCDRAEDLLVRRGLGDHLEKIRVDQDRERLVEMLRMTQRRTVPQIFIGDHHVGGYDDLVELDMDGALNELLTEAGIA